MGKSINMVVVFVLVVFLFVPSANAFGFDIFKSLKKQPVIACEPDEALDSLVYSYNASNVSEKVFDLYSRHEINEQNSTKNQIALMYMARHVTQLIRALTIVRENGYWNIDVMIEKDYCAYEYTVTMTDSGEVLISDGLLDVELKISTTYDNVFFAHKSYVEHDSLGVLKSSLRVKMPIKAKIKAILFLRSYV
ncbi:MAG: hypothetical protein ABIG84_07805 [archaeon]